MSQNSKIEWTDHTFNPWWGCQKVSDGCTNCYAETFSKRTGHAIWGPPAATSRRLFGAKHWAEPLKWHNEALAAGERKRVFCASMADVFEDHPEVVEARAQLWETISACSSLDWLLLTKRPENVMRMMPIGWKTKLPPHIWIGTSVEDERVTGRISHLLQVPAAVRFLSCEPLIGAVDLSPWLDNISNLPDMPGDWCPPPRTSTGWYRINDFEPDIHWVILGGESGPRHRAMDVDWLRQTAEQCLTAGVAVFVKQDSGQYPGKQGRIPDELMLKQFPASAVPS